MEKQSPRVSVVLPTYNRGSTIQHAIRSIIDQSFKDWELIVVDDGSDDSTKRIVESFAYPRIIYKKTEHTGFVSRVRNEGNRLASGEIIVVQDSDDMSLPDRLEEIVKAFEEDPEADVIYHGMYQRYFDPYHDAIVRKSKPALPYSKERLTTEQYIPGQVAYRRSLALKCPYDERIRCCDDYQILLEFSLSGAKFKPIYKNLYEYADSPDSINVNGEKDGSRRNDIKIILSILKEKYGVEKSATLVKNTIDTNETISREDII